MSIPGKLKALEKAERGQPGHGEPAIPEQIALQSRMSFRSAAFRANLRLDFVFVLDPDHTFRGMQLLSTRS
jgi:hypothetical protein